MSVRRKLDEHEDQLTNLSRRLTLLEKQWEQLGTYERRLVWFERWLMRQADQLDALLKDLGKEIVRGPTYTVKSITSTETDRK